MAGIAVKKGIEDIAREIYNKYKK
jgi:hypothetical protein